ncbi:MAG: CPXCG motif-containing cysteine-rich protein [Ignavibacteria bacterium GWA2_55_11]|nr:MAG: CPXCG motif-containing cysteine-rich protein [Ignavibacteria bacterium GWA2_55_11]OGU46467.1 MAG: CPXCG motif-containing cysteine-rich protein [Ignavibacteria bacterium GWC2_56_12]HAV23343.1 CPXCG motif-containing cysteine-rich protein [Bacteroidota bacterium]
MTYRCAYCGEENETLVDPTGGVRQTYTEDCVVCCRANVVRIVVDLEHGHVTVEAAQES